MPRGLSGLFSGLTFSDCQTVVSAHARTMCPGKNHFAIPGTRVQFLNAARSGVVMVINPRNLSLGDCACFQQGGDLLLSRRAMAACPVYFLGPNKALPIRTMVAPSAIARR